MTLLQSIVLFAASSIVTGADIAERIQPDLDTFVFCVLDGSVAQLPTDLAPDVIASLAADACTEKLDHLERAVASQYREVNKDVWPTGLAEQVARENRDEYRKLAVAAAAKIVEERRSSP